jgi:hypothetical protein
VDYAIAIPAWGASLPPEKWYYGRGGLWHEAFDAIPYHQGKFDNKFLKKQYANDPIYRKEIKHRLWAITDGPLNPSELHMVEDKKENPRDYYGGSTEYFLMKKRRETFHDSVVKAYKESLNEFMPPE